MPDPICKLSAKQSSTADAIHTRVAALARNDTVSTGQITDPDLHLEIGARLPVCHIVEHFQALKKDDSRIAFVNSVRNEASVRTASGDEAGAETAIGVLEKLPDLNDTQKLFYYMARFNFNAISGNKQLAIDFARKASEAAEELELKRATARNESGKNQPYELGLRIAKLQADLNERGKEIDALPLRQISAEDLARLSKPLVTTEPGSTSAGKVNIFGQIHVFPTQSLATKLEVGRLQSVIAKTLENRKISDLFLESRNESYGNNPTDRAALTAFVQDLFPQDILNDLSNDSSKNKLTNRQLYVLSELGADLVYAGLNPKVKLHGTITQFEQQMVDFSIIELPRAVLSNCINDISSTETCINQLQFSGLAATPLIIGYREFRTIQSVKNFMDQNPKQEVGIVYGANHGFPAELWKFVYRDKPLPERVKHQWIELRDSLLAAKPNLQSQARLLNEAQLMGFPPGQTRAQALKLLPPFPLSQSNREQYKNVLKQLVCPPRQCTFEVEKRAESEIQHLETNSQGPFSNTK